MSQKSGQESGGAADNQSSAGNETLRGDIIPSGSPVGSYTVEEPCGEGGFAVVYRGVHEKLLRPAAIKLLRGKLVNRTDIVARFEKEAQTITRIRHHNIVDIYDFGTHTDGRPYFVMEWLDGILLSDEIYRKRGLPPGELLDIASQIAAGLQVIHAEGVVHRDLKANNIMLVNSDGKTRVKLLDFGIAKLINDNSGLSL